MISRRRLLKLSAGSVLAPAVAVCEPLVLPSLPKRAVDAVFDSTVIDMLGLLTLDYRKLSEWQADPSKFSDAEFRKFKASGVNIIHPAVGFVREHAKASSWNDLNGWNRFIEAHPAKFVRVLQPADIAEAKRSGRIGVILGLQNSKHFDALGEVDRFYSLGQRVSQLTYETNSLGGGAGASSVGLSQYGLQVVERMNRLGMVIDLSHCSDRTTLDAIEASSKPVLVTHSNCRALVPSNARCKTDEAIRKMAVKGGVFGLTMVRGFVRSAPSVTMEDVLDHADHLIHLVGVEHIGLGTDVDLVGRDTRNDLDRVQYSRKIYDFTDGLLRRGYSHNHIGLILGGNFQRALSQIWT